MVAHADLRPEFHDDLDNLRAQIARLGATVVELIPRATNILLEQDLEGAEYVLRGDADIDVRALQAEEHTLAMLALQAPVAQDLREIASAFKLSTEIERSADLCANLCKAARRIYGHELDPKLRGLIQRMSDQAMRQYKSAVDSYIARDALRAAAIEDMDDYLDDLHRQFISQILESHAAGSIDLTVAVQMAVAARFYERLGDHSVTISHRVRYIVDGWEQSAPRDRTESLGLLEVAPDEAV